MLALADVLLVNEIELALFSGAPPVDREPELVLSFAARLRRRPDQIIVVTLGSRGAVALSGSERLILPGHTVRAVDTTGAGDCFAGALAASLAQGAVLTDALEAANAAAALAVQRAGAATSSPTRRELEEFLVREVAARRRA